LPAQVRQSPPWGYYLQPANLGCAGSIQIAR
jgi:hypothetical protein